MPTTRTIGDLVTGDYPCCNCADAARQFKLVSIAKLKNTRAQLDPFDVFFNWNSTTDIFHEAEWAFWYACVSCGFVVCRDETVDV